MNDRAYWLAWSQITGIGPVLRKRLQQQFGQLAIAWDADWEALLAVDGIGEKSARSILEQRQKIHPQTLYDDYLAVNPDFLTPADPSYPRLLWEIPDPPAVLHYRGNLDLLHSVDDDRAIALVGTRDPSEYGKRWTKRISQILSQQGLTLVSGLAMGVDAIAHQTAVDLRNPTIGVLGNGVDVIYPTQNRQLYEQMERGGLILSEYPSGMQPDRRHFPMRNRIVAGLCRATIVLEAGEHSGALITARLANDMGRDVFALAGSLDNPQALGCLNLISQGAQIIVSEAQLLGAIGNMSPVEQTVLFDFDRLTPVPAPMPELSDTLKPIWRVIAESNEPLLLDRIVEETGLPTGNVLSGLLELELLGIIEQQAGMRYQVA
jgi:DNA processing protein